MPSQNGIMGDENFGIDLPQTEPIDDLDAERRMVKFSKTKEFKQLQAHIEGRILFYQTYLPDGRALTTVSDDERGAMWVAANAIIGELKGLLLAYDQAVETVKNAR
jgi:hypothetical protein